MREALPTYSRTSPDLLRDFRMACKAIIDAPTRGANMGFAKSYAFAGRHLLTPEGIKMQANYILANLSGWRGPQAKATRQLLKDIVQELS